MAKTTVSAGYIAANAITATELAANSVTAASIASGAILSVDVGANSVTSTAIAANAVNTSEVASNAISTAQIASNAVTAASIATNAVGADQISPNAVESSEIASNAVGTAQIAGNSVGISELNVTDGTNGQYLQTNGSGTLSFSTVSGYTDSDVETYLDGGTSTPTFSTAVITNDLSVENGKLTINEFTSPEAYTQIRKTNTGSNLAIVSQESIYMLLDENNDQTTRAFFIKHGTGAPGSGTTVFKVEESGNVGIGTETTQAELHVVDSLTGNNSNITTSSPTIGLFERNGDAEITILGNAANHTAINFSDDTHSAGEIRYVHGTGTDEMRFYTASTQRVVIDSSGNVGIGTDNPQRKFHALDSTTGSITGRIEHDQANGIAGFQFYNSAGTRGHLGMAGTGSNVWADQFFIGTIDDKQVVLTQNDVGVMTIDTTSGNSTIGFAKPVHFVTKQGYRHSDSCAEVLVKLPYFTNGVSNLAADIEFGNIAMNGILEVILLGTYSYTNSIGEIRKRWEIGFNTNGSIWGTPRLMEEASSGQIVDEVFMSDPFWDSGDSKYKIRIYHKTDLGNNYNALVRLYGHVTADNVVNNIDVSSLLSSTSTTSESQHVRKFSEPVVHAYRAVAGSILPTALVGCDSWYDLSGRHSTVERQGTNNDQLKSCSDASGNSRSNLIKNPQFGTSVLASREAFPSGVFGYRFDTTSYITGTSDTSGYLPPTGTSARTLWCIVYNFQEITTQPINHFLHYGSNTTGQAFGIAFTPSNNVIQMHSWAGSGRTVDFDTDIAGGFVDNDTAPTGVWVLFTQIYGDGSGNGETRVYRGGMEGVSNIGSVAGLSTGAGYALHVGSRIYVSNGTECCDVVIGEFGAYSRKLSTKEMDLLAHSLLLRWS